MRLKKQFEILIGLGIISLIISTVFSFTLIKQHAAMEKLLKQR